MPTKKHPSPQIIRKRDGWTNYDEAPKPLARKSKGSGVAEDTDSKISTNPRPVQRRKPKLEKSIRLLKSSEDPPVETKPKPRTKILKTPHKIRLLQEDFDIEQEDIFEKLSRQINTIESAMTAAAEKHKIDDVLLESISEMKALVKSDATRKVAERDDGKQKALEGIEARLQEFIEEVTNLKERLDERKEGNRDGKEENVEVEQPETEETEEKTPAEPTKSPSTSPIRKSKRAKPSTKHRKSKPSRSILAVRINRIHNLRVPVFLSQIHILVHLLDESTRSHIRKESVSNPSTFFYEPKRNVSKILPILTSGHIPTQSHGKTFTWNEEIQINETLEHLLANYSTSPLLLFEVVTYANAKLATDSLKEINEQSIETGWHTLAWAYLRKVSLENFDSTLRLQLYQVPRSECRSVPRLGDRKPCEWVFGEKQALDATLFIQLKKRAVEGKQPAALRSFNPFQPETACEESEKLCSEIQPDTHPDVTSIQLPKKVSFSEPVDTTPIPDYDERLDHLHRNPSEPCLIPDSVLHRIPSGKSSCSVVKFAPDGKTLVCGMLNEKSEGSVQFYDVATGEMTKEVKAHCDR